MPFTVLKANFDACEELWCIWTQKHIYALVLWLAQSLMFKSENKQKLDSLFRISMMQIFNKYKTKD